MPLDSVGYIHVKHSGGGITHLFEDDLFCSRGIQSLNDTSHLNQDLDGALGALGERA